MTTQKEKMDHRPKNGEERIEAFRQIVKQGAYAKIDGCLMDLFTASVVVQVYDSLNDKNRKTLMDFTADRAGMLALKVAGKIRS